MIKDHKDHLDDTKPSEEFMTALKELKPTWRDDARECDLEVVQKKYNSLIALGKREGLSSDFVNSKLDERIVNCQVCNQEVITYRSDDPLCPKM